MTYAFVQDIASTWEQYQRITASLVEPAPPGLILHVAGPTDEGFRIIDVWEDEASLTRFQPGRLFPALAKVTGSNERPADFEVRDVTSVFQRV